MNRQVIKLPLGALQRSPIGGRRPRGAEKTKTAVLINIGWHHMQTSNACGLGQ